MGLKAGLQIIQQAEKVATGYADYAVGIFCRKPVTVNPAELKGLRFAPEAIGDTVVFSHPITYTELTKSDFVGLISKQPFIVKTRNPRIRSYDSLFIGHRGGQSTNEGVNTFLRTGEIPWHLHKKEALEEIIDSAHFAMQKSKLTKDTILYRYVEDMDYLPKVGEIFTEKGFLSTGFDKSLIGTYGRKLITVKVPKDTPYVVDINGSYGEVLLLDGLSFRVTQKSDFGAELICEKVRKLSREELVRTAEYAKKVQLESRDMIDEMIEFNFPGWK